MDLVEVPVHNTLMRIGPYELIDQLGSGGMCDVWRARTDGGAELALKVMRPETPADLFQQEIQAMARLNHPSIVQILRWGYANAQDACKSNVAVGTPWFAMRVAEHGAFKPGSITTWDEFLWFATTMLKALSHSHARSFIHRDIKPENILVEGDLARPHYILSDFGISMQDRIRVTDSREIPYAAAGTPGYISPEQLVGRWRDFGPYTDLFSLGVVFYQVIYGQLPFVAPNLLMLGIAHTKGADFSSLPRFATPKNLKKWLAHLLAYDPCDRFALAPDALRALVAMTPPTDKTPATSAPVDRLRNTTLPLPILTTQTVASTNQQTAFSATVHLGDGQTLFEDWSESSGQSEPIGLELFGLRRAHLVGRKPERDLCWSILRQCLETKTSHVLVLSGADGVGSTMLGQWIGEHAAELGIAAHGHVRSDSGTSAITDTLIRILGLFGLDDTRTQQRLSQLFEGTDVDAEWVTRSVLGPGMSLSDQAKLVRQVLTVLTLERPIVVLMDDAHHDLEMLEIAHALSGAPIPVLFVLSARSDDPEPMPHETARLNELLELEHAHLITLMPLSDDETGEFVDSIASLKVDVRARVLEFAHGNPLHALHILEIWNLTHDLEGLDADHFDLWNRRFDHHFGAMERRAVEVAAALGESIQQDDWRQVCAACDLPVDLALVDRLIAARIWSNDNGVLRFEHSSMRDSILRSANSNQLKKVHSAAAAMYGAVHSRLEFGRHLVLSGDADRGMQVLHEIAYELLLRFRTAEAKSLSAWCASRLAGSADDSKARLFLDLIRANIAHREGDDGVLEEAERIRILAEHAGFGTIAAEAIRIRTVCEDPFIDPDRPAAHLVTAMERAIDLATEENDPNVMARLRHRLGFWYLAADQPKSAAKILRLNAKSPNNFFASRSLAALGQTLIELGELDEALEVTKAAAEIAPLAIGASQLMESFNTRSEIQRIMGDIQAADASMDNVEKYIDYEYDVDRATVVINRAAIRLGDGDTKGCRAGIVEALSMLEEVDPYFAFHCAVLQAVAAAYDGDAGAWEEALAAGASKLPGAVYGHFWLDAAQKWQEAGDEDRKHQAVEIGLSTVPEHNDWLRAKFRKFVQE